MKRQLSNEWCQSHGLQINPNLPPINDVAIQRSTNEISNRISCLNAVAASAYGFPTDDSIEWLKKHQIYNSLESQERDFLETSNKENIINFKYIPNSLWVMLWACGIYQSIDLGKQCPDDLVNKLPSLKHDASPLKNLKALNDNILNEKLDLLYCINWAVVENGNTNEGIFDLYTVQARRRPLEWLLSKDNWWETTLDT